MRTQYFGDIRVDSIPELESTFEAGSLFRGATTEEAIEHEHWLGPRMVDLKTHRLRSRSHAYLIRTRHHIILFDTCCGNDKEREEVPKWHRLRTNFLGNLARAGARPEQVDFVMCSHLHADHVGWHTQLLNGEWVPTFPNARYLISRGEFEYWREFVESGNAHPFRRLAWDDSILPVVDRGLAAFVEDEYAVENEMPDEVRYMPLRGHTPHHCGLYLCSKTQDAIFSGDAIHHPIQFARRDWVNGADHPACRQCISDLIARCIDTPTKLLTAHFPAPTAGRVVSAGNDVRFRFDGD